MFRSVVAIHSTFDRLRDNANAFFTIVQEGKGDMEYLAGIYGAMQGDTSAQHDTYRGMLAMDEYGTRRVKQWMKSFIEPGLKQLGQVVMQFAQSLYTAHKVFRIVQPSAIQEQREVEINIPMYANATPQTVVKASDAALATLAELVDTVQMGVQTTQGDSSRLFNRHFQDEAQVIEACKILTGYGIKVKLEVIIGLPNIDGLVTFPKLTV